MGKSMAGVKTAYLSPPPALAGGGEKKGKGGTVSLVFLPPATRAARMEKEIARAGDHLFPTIAAVLCTAAMVGESVAEKRKINFSQTLYIRSET